MVKDTVAALTQMETDPLFYGVAGEGCAMHTLELITPQKDTLDFLLSDDRSPSAVIGDVIIGNRYVVTLQKDKESVKTAVNLTQLTAHWKTANSGLLLMADGKARSEGHSATYTQWQLDGNRLLLRTLTDGGRKEAFNRMDTLYMKDLTQDSLIVTHHGKRVAYFK